MKTPLDKDSERARAALVALAPIVTPGNTGEVMDPEWGQGVMLEALVTLLHYCRVSEVDFDRTLNSARYLFAGNLAEDIGEGGVGQ